jgi:transposase-like protein
LFPAEDEMAFSQFFQKLYDLGYDLRIVVADDRDGLKQALLKVFPYAKLQLCHNHYLDNIRKLLNIRTSDKYLHFFNSLKLHVFTEGTDEQKITNGLRHVMEKHASHNKTLQNILFAINARRIDLFNYLKVPNCPNTTNLIESYNSHLNGRLETIKKFQSFDSAQRWLNGYFIRRRTKQFTDCKGKFKYLNKHASLEFTIKKQAAWPEVLKKLGIKIIKFFQKSD